MGKRKQRIDTCPHCHKEGGASVMARWHFENCVLIKPRLKGATGMKRSEEHKRKISEAHKGKKRRIVTCPHCHKKGAEGIMGRWHFDNCVLITPRKKNKPFTEEVKRRISETSKRNRRVGGKYPPKPLSEEARRKISEAHKGRKHSEEHIKASADARRGMKHSEEAKLNMSKAQKERWRKQGHHSEETKRKMSEAKKGKKRGAHSEETKQHLSKIKTGVPHINRMDILTCPYCYKEGRRNGMTRWHFENCQWG